MEKEAWVVDVNGDEVRLRYTRHSACRKCGACLVLGNSLSEQEIVLPKDQLDLAKGDRVAIGLKESSILKASFMVYALPLILFLLGYLGGAHLGSGFMGEALAEAAGLLGGVLALALAYGGLYLYDRRLQKTERYQPYIARVLERSLPE
ncbi:MAG TPA: SoxR reducing system RseC family protein [Hydrogenispora sp.]|jgi:sigma-E factor negative regulatory protein RseC|nr:SoxR reducing system RseC family protein [Hydrogenispora sp.]